jgi:hypothetical protein
MDIYRIATTSYEEEDFHIMTSLTESQIVKVIKPIVQAERDNDVEENFYDNDTLVEALKRAYPKDTIEMYQDFETITI